MFIYYFDIVLSIYLLLFFTYNTICNTIATVKNVMVTELWYHD